MFLEGKAGSVGELVAEVGRLTEAFKPDYQAPEEIWFRGQSKVAFSLLPLLYRPSIAQYHYDEPSLFERFQALATPIVLRQPGSEWEWYFVARHHGLPSRLLDWSDSLLPALYFALATHVPSDCLALDRALHAPLQPPSYDDDSPIIWMLDAGSLNLASIGEDCVIAPGGRVSAEYLPQALSDHSSSHNAKPIALLPARVTERIVAQQGMFTVHGHERAPINDLVTTEPSIKLARIILDQSRVAQFCNELAVLGVHRLSLFPDLDTVAAHVCWICQSET